MKLLIATHNRGKVQEYRELLQDPTLELLTLDEVGIQEDVEEAGATYEANARLKAVTYAAQSGLLALADDSGLDVDALNGEPGIHSKRYAGPGKNDAERNEYLLAKLKNVPRGKRTARFRCVIMIADPQGNTWTTEGTCEGDIATEPRGTNGFGYDPIFIPRGDSRHLAELSSEEKNVISHRGRAAVGARGVLSELGAESRRTVNPFQ